MKIGVSSVRRYADFLAERADDAHRFFNHAVQQLRGFGGGGGLYPWMNQANLTSEGFQNQLMNNNITSIRAREEKIMLRSIRIDSNAGLFSGVLTVLVDDTDTIGKLVKKIKGVKGVVGVERA